MSNEELLTIKETANVLKLAEKTVYSMAQNREFPAFKVRGQWRIRGVDFDRWMAEAAASARNNGKDERLTTQSSQNGRTHASRS